MYDLVDFNLLRLSVVVVIFSKAVYNDLAAIVISIIGVPAGVDSTVFKEVQNDFNSFIKKDNAEIVWLPNKIGSIAAAPSGVNPKLILGASRIISRLEFR